jgi:DnaJ-class molecular chaperone
MKTPYDILGISTEATNSEVKQAYLQHVKDNPPDHDQENFLVIHQAYLLIKDEKSRMSYDLFTLPSADFNRVLDTVLRSDQPTSLDSDVLHSILSMGIDEEILLNAMSGSKQ